MNVTLDCFYIILQQVKINLFLKFSSRVFKNIIKGQKISFKELGRTDTIGYHYIYWYLPTHINRYIGNLINKMKRNEGPLFGGCWYICSVYTSFYLHKDIDYNIW